MVQTGSAMPDTYCESRRFWQKAGLRPLLHKKSFLPRQETFSKGHSLLFFIETSAMR
jgi:hypothetical protein